MLESLFFYLGMSLIIELLFEIYPLLLTFISKPNFNKYQGSWAIITGSTDGIGLGYCESFAKLGINIIQISRTPSKLARVGSDLTSKYGIQVKNICRDFGECPKDPSKFFKGIFDEIGELDVKILVNNVGYVSVKVFHEQDLSTLLLENSCNIWPIVYMTKFFLNLNKSAHKEKLVINLSSFTGTFGFKLVVNYSACKSFDKVFSNVLSEEFINCTSIQPGLVSTAMTKNVENKKFEIRVEDLMEASLKVIGKVKNTYGHLTHYTVSALFYFITGHRNLLANIF